MEKEPIIPQPKGTGCQPIGGLMPQIVPTAPALALTSSAPPTNSATIGTPKPDNAPVKSTGRSLGSAGAAVLQKALATGEAREALAVTTASWPPPLNKLITTQTVPTKRIFRLGRSDLEEWLGETDVPGCMWHPGPITAEEADIACATLEVYERLLKPAGKAKLVEPVCRLLIPYGFLPRSGHDKQLLLDQWQLQLQDFPLWVVKEVTLHWQRTQPSMPSIAEIVTRCESRLFPIRTQQTRVERIVSAWDENRFYRYVTEGSRAWWEPIDRNGNLLPPPQPTTPRPGPSCA